MSNSSIFDSSGNDVLESNALVSHPDHGESLQLSLPSEVLASSLDTKKFKEEKDLERFEAELKDIVLNNINEKIEEMMQTNKTFANYLKKINSKKIDPYSAADKISKSIMK